MKRISNAVLKALRDPNVIDIALAALWIFQWFLLLALFVIALVYIVFYFGPACVLIFIGIVGLLGPVIYTFVKSIIYHYKNY